MFVKEVGGNTMGSVFTLEQLERFLLDALKFQQFLMFIFAFITLTGELWYLCLKKLNGFKTAEIIDLYGSGIKDIWRIVWKMTDSHDKNNLFITNDHVTKVFYTGKEDITDLTEFSDSCDLGIRRLCSRIVSELSGYGTPIKIKGLREVFVYDEKKHKVILGLLPRTIRGFGLRLFLCATVVFVLFGVIAGITLFI